MTTIQATCFLCQVLVSEQEQRDLENLLDPVNIREQLQPPMPGEMPAPREPIIAGTPAVMNLTRNSLLKHTLLQEQLYLASASPERNILFLNDTPRESPASSSRKRHSLKRIHSPDFSREQCKSGRRNEDITIPTTGSVLNPIFPLISFDSRGKNSCSSIHSFPKMMPVVVPMQMYPIMSSNKNSISQLSNTQPNVGTKCNGKC